MSEQNHATTSEELAKNQHDTIVKLLPNADQLFFDSLVHLAVGPFLAKISFGNQNPADNTVMSVTTVTLPTSVLADLALNIANGFATPGAVDQLAAGQEAFLKVANNFRQDR